MPVIVQSENTHPFLPSLGSPSAISDKRAVVQDIRPLEIAIINLMADKQATERQLALWLGHTPLQVHLTFAATDSYVNDVRNGRETRNTPAEHIRKFYNAFSDIKNQTFDGLLVTGVNALQPRVQDETMWPEVTEILDWSQHNVFASLFLCWGAKAALKHFHDIDSISGAEKLFGVFPHHLGTDSTGLAFGLPDTFPLPVSRWKSPPRDAVEACKGLEIVADSMASGPNIIAEPARTKDGEIYAKRAYILGHPEYDTETMRLEYERDRKNVPENYFPDNDPAQTPINTWRGAAQVYTNWVHSVYKATPYMLADIKS